MEKFEAYVKANAGKIDSVVLLTVDHVRDGRYGVYDSDIAISNIECGLFLLFLGARIAYYCENGTYYKREFRIYNRSQLVAGKAIPCFLNRECVVIYNVAYSCDKDDFISAIRNSEFKSYLYELKIRKRTPRDTEHQVNIASGGTVVLKISASVAEKYGITSVRGDLCAATDDVVSAANGIISSENDDYEGVFNGYPRYIICAAANLLAEVGFDITFSF